MTNLLFWHKIAAKMFSCRLMYDLFLYSNSTKNKNSVNYESLSSPKPSHSSLNINNLRYNGINSAVLLSWFSYAGQVLPGFLPGCAATSRSRCVTAAQLRTEFSFPVAQHLPEAMWSWSFFLNVNAEHEPKIARDKDSVFYIQITVFCWGKLSFIIHWNCFFFK